MAPTVHTQHRVTVLTLAGKRAYEIISDGDQVRIELVREVDVPRLVDPKAILTALEALREAGVGR